MKVVFVGDKPSRLNKDPNVAFVGAKCHKRLMKWINFLETENYKLINSHNEDCKLALLYINIFSKIENIKFIALGKTASKRLSNLGIDHYKLDHPSGLNRKLNNKEYELDMLKKCRKWLYESD